jgi:uncharacterized glyoxalase superfamily protein PhnB
MNKLTPNLMVGNVGETVEFYRQHLGFRLVMAVPEGQDGILTEIPEQVDLVYALVQNGGVELMLQAEKSLKEDVPAFAGMKIGASIALYIEVDGIDNMYKAIRPEVEIVKELFTTWYGMREFYLRDNNGYILCLAEHHDTGK